MQKRIPSCDSMEDKGADLTPKEVSPQDFKSIVGKDSLKEVKPDTPQSMESKSSPKQAVNEASKTASKEEPSKKSKVTKSADKLNTAKAILVKNTADTAPQIPDIEIIGPDGNPSEGPAIMRAENGNSSEQPKKSQNPSSDELKGADSEQKKSCFSPPTRNRILLIFGIITGLVILAIILGITLSNKHIPVEIPLSYKSDHCPLDVLDKSSQHVPFKGSIIVDGELPYGVAAKGHEFHLAALNVSQEFDQLLRASSIGDKFICSQIKSFSRGSIITRFILHFRSWFDPEVIQMNFINAYNNRSFKILNGTPIISSLNITEIRPVFLSAALSPSARSSGEDDFKYLIDGVLSGFSSATTRPYIHNNILHIQVYPYDDDDMNDLETSIGILARNTSELSLLGLSNVPKISNLFPIYTYLQTDEGELCLQNATEHLLDRKVLQDIQFLWEISAHCSETIPGMYIIELKYTTFVTPNSVTKMLRTALRRNYHIKSTGELSYYAVVKRLGMNLEGEVLKTTLDSIVSNSGLDRYVLDHRIACLNTKEVLDIEIIMKDYLEPQLMKNAIQYGLTKYLNCTYNDTNTILQDVYVLRYLVNTLQTFSYYHNFSEAEDQLGDVLSKVPSLSDILIRPRLKYILNRTLLLEVTFTDCPVENVINLQFWNALIVYGTMDISMAESVYSLEGFHESLLSIRNLGNLTKYKSDFIAYVESLMVNLEKDPSVILSVRPDSMDTPDVIVDVWIDTAKNITSIRRAYEDKLETLLLQFLHKNGSSFDEDLERVTLNPNDPIWKALYEDYLITKTFKPTDMLVPTSSVPFWVTRSTAAPVIRRRDSSYVNAMPVIHHNDHFLPHYNQLAPRKSIPHLNSHLMLGGRSGSEVNPEPIAPKVSNSDPSLHHEITDSRNEFRGHWEKNPIVALSLNSVKSERQGTPVRASLNTMTALHNTERYQSENLPGDVPSSIIVDVGEDYRPYAHSVHFVNHNPYQARQHDSLAWSSSVERRPILFRQEVPWLTLNKMRNPFRRGESGHRTNSAPSWSHPFNRERPDAHLLEEDTESDESDADMERLRNIHFGAKQKDNRSISELLNIRESMYKTEIAGWNDNGSNIYTPEEFEKFYQSRMYPEEEGITGRSAFSELLLAILVKMVTKIKPGQECGSGQWKCKNQVECVHNKAVCDGKVQCSDLSDETDCNCKTRAPSAYICNGRIDCHGGEDEMGCSELGCQDDELSCNDGIKKCYSLSKRCDGTNDCDNGEDEKLCYVLGDIYTGKVTFTNSFGVIYRAIGNSWYPLCGSSVEDAIVRIVCDDVMGIYEGNPVWLPEKTKANMTFANVGSNSLVHGCKDHVFAVKCPDPPCGRRAEEEKGLTFSKRSVSEQDNVEFDIDERIVGGKQSESGMWPWLAGIYKDGKLICGGSIINKDHILTAAHCFSNSHKVHYPSHHYDVQVGLYEKEKFSPLVQTRAVEYILLHEGFDKHFRNDLALLKLESPVHYNRYTRPICLSDKDTTMSKGKWCTVVGWGALFETGPEAKVLQELEMPILDKCLESFNDDTSQICSGFLEGGKDSCQGDSGGPLLCKSEDDTNLWIQFGVVSFGRGCARKNSVGVYSRVSYFHDWISLHLNKPAPKMKPLLKCPGMACRNGGLCLDKKYVCDKQLHCLGGEDEKNCTRKN